MCLRVSEERWGMQLAPATEGSPAVTQTARDESVQDASCQPGGNVEAFAARNLRFQRPGGVEEGDENRSIEDGTRDHGSLEDRRGDQGPRRIPVRGAGEHEGRGIATDDLVAFAA